MTAAVSVIVPTFRRLERLPDLLTRLATIDHAADLDIVIVDQTPGADLSALERFSEHFASLRCMSLAEANVALARNTGAEAASCDILLFMDDDMALDRFFIPHLLSLMGRMPRTVLGAVWPHQVAIDRADGLPSTGQDDEALTFLPTGALAISRWDFLTAGGFDARLERYFEDAEFSHRLKQLGLRLIRHPDLKAEHHDHQENGTWYSRSMMEAAPRLMQQTAYFRRKTGRSWAKVLFALLRVIASETRRPGYLRGGTQLTRAAALGVSLPAALIYAARSPLLAHAPSSGGKAG
ncbi:glycosyltransferase family 2 protein [Labrys sp. La1]|uniref:glycosyltransferase family 2 protein n=1 Tax=Labrys sp. La1 TaxID=3404917 RepID=UPI003EB88E86